MPRPEALDDRLLKPVGGEELLAALSAQEIHWGPLWQWLQDGRIGATGASAALVPTYAGAHDLGPLHPCLLDNGFGLSVLGSFLGAAVDGTPRLPFAMERLRWWAAPRGVVRCAGFLRPNTVDVADCVLIDEDGSVVAEVEGFALRRAPREVFLRQESAAATPGLLRIEWRDAPLTATPRTRREEAWVIVAAPGSPRAEALGARLDRSVVTDPAGLPAALAHAGGPVAGVVCLWEAGSAEEAPEAAQRLATEGLSVARALLGRAPAPLVWSDHGRGARRAQGDARWRWPRRLSGGSAGP